MTTIPTALDRRFRDAADREGLVDVAYDLTESPVGPLLRTPVELGHRDNRNIQLLGQQLELAGELGNLLLQVSGDCGGDAASGLPLRVTIVAQTAASSWRRRKNAAPSTIPRASLEAAAYPGRPGRWRTKASGRTRPTRSITAGSSSPVDRTRTESSS